MMGSNLLSWLIIIILVIQSGIFSGMNLAMFGFSILRLQTLANSGEVRAEKLLKMRGDSNFLLTTILWGNVATNVLLTLVSDSVMAGALGFVFSTVVITFCGEIIPQAFFSRYILLVSSLFIPVIRIYQILLYPVAKPSALLLDRWLGSEGVDYISEHELIEGIRLHSDAENSQMSPAEGQGAINFLSLDDLLFVEEGEIIDPDSILETAFSGGRPVFPAYKIDANDEFLSSIHKSGKKWVFLTDGAGAPLYSLNASAFLRDVLFSESTLDPFKYCSEPIYIQSKQTRLEDVLGKMEAMPGKDLLERDLILFWGEEKRLLTGDDLLGYLMRGIAKS